MQSWGQKELLNIKYKLLKYKKISFDIYDKLIKRDTRKSKGFFICLLKNIYVNLMIIKG